MLIIFLAFVISFIVWYILVKGKYKKIDIVYIFTLNILAMAIGAKIFSIIDNREKFTIVNFIDSGYGFLGGLIGSFICVYWYCKKYKLNYIKMQVKFTIIYPLIYSISKIGCFMNGCCEGNIGNIPLQLIEFILFFIFFIFLISHFRNESEKSGISVFLIIFGILKFIIECFRVKSNIVLLNLTMSQICCLNLLIVGIIFKIFKFKE